MKKKVVSIKKKKKTGAVLKVSKKRRAISTRGPTKKLSSRKKTSALAAIKGGVEKTKPGKIAGRVMHYYGGIGVAVIKCNAVIEKGASIAFRGSTTDYSDVVKSLQYDHKDIAKAKKGQEVGIKVKKRVREGDAVYFL